MPLTSRAVNVIRKCSVLFALFTLTLLVGGCRSRQGGVAKPAGVPADAFRVGGADGGVYVELKKVASDPADSYQGTIFEERTGIVWYRGKLKLLPNGNATIDVKDADLFSGWDGDALLLKDGRKLVAQK
jgi:hypothetical protein